MIQSMKKNGLLLALFGLGAAGLVAITYEGTKAQIAEQKQQQLIATLAQIIPADRFDNEPHKACHQIVSEQYLGNDRPHQAFVATFGDAPVAMAIETTAPDGYNGEIEIIVGVDWQGNLLGVRTLQHNETPGLGDLIDTRRSDWVDSFVGYRLESENDSRFNVKRDGGDFDQFTGATITPRAYVKAVKNTLNYFNRNKDVIAAAPQCGAQS
ncbi:electron transport complex subunit RsxG [Ferrimonas lipolytica]|uniref:Ion-translocating oxidoreductase complex subunit G n=1 Tax=Ferrimonas lipolytica TaxID=2724191 RepID=A0A6H1UDB7_9GAMM|nr:electron transport complex subunit RsxG [Ferrimonas lipolytica]QIZ76206.1 electron transport complex subunit RsxG [Ferrimonas lipolytica]